MRAWCLVAVLLAGAAHAEPVVLPSGLSVEFLDRIVEQHSDGETWLTLRFVSPQIGVAAVFGCARIGSAGLLPAGCDGLGVVRVDAIDPASDFGIDEGVISAADRECAHRAAHGELGACEDQQQARSVRQGAQHRCGAARGVK